MNLKQKTGGRKVKIKCIYKNGKTKEITAENEAVKKVYKTVIAEMIKGNKEKKGLSYSKFKGSGLIKIYVDGELVLDKEDD